MIFTSYYGNVERLKKFGVPEENFIGISLYKFKWLKFEIKYEQKICSNLGVFWNYKNGEIDWEEYCKKYYEKLNSFSDEYWEEFIKKYNGKILLCYEKEVKKCHRYLLGKYLNWKYGKIKVVEVDDNIKFWGISNKNGLEKIGK